jgi:hypothetical protein
LSADSHNFAPGPSPNTVRAFDGRVLTAPEGWVLLPPGDATLTRRVKAARDHWIVQEKKVRKVFSRGVWAPAATIERIRADLEAERATEGYSKRKAAEAHRREKAQTEYVEASSGRLWHFWHFIRTTPILPTGWPVPSPIMPRQSEVAPSPEPSASQLSSVPKLP